MAKKMLGFDIGNYNMKIVVVNGTAIERCISVPVPDNMVVNSQIRAFTAAGDFIREAMRENGIRCRKCAVALPEKSYYIRRVRLPKMTVSQLMVNLPYEFHDYVTGEASEYVYDYAVRAMGERTMELTICAISKQKITQYRDMMRRAGLKLEKLVPDVLAVQSVLNQKPLPIRVLDDAPAEPVQAAEKEKTDFGRGIDSSVFAGPVAAAASGTADGSTETREYQGFNPFTYYTDPAVAEKTISALSPDGTGAGKDVTTGTGSEPEEDQTEADAEPLPEKKDAPKDFAVLDLGHGGTRIHFYSGGTYEITRMLVGGAKELLDMIVSEQGLDPHIARLILEQNQDGIMQTKPVQDRLDAVATEVMRTINFYNYNNPNNTIECLHYFGKGLNMDDLYERIREMTGLPVRPITEMIDGSEAFPELIMGPQAYGAVIE
ncbi:pilus assembly protein PilM [[Clostridium] aminophilum]|uniref:pilus assembly protein PilM n=1 Tax=[Clostridium] aminophilum TaxID=1526 RepID=UPI00331667FB